MYSQALQFLFAHIERFGEKIVLASCSKRMDKVLRAPTFEELYENPQRYKGRFLV